MADAIDHGNLSHSSNSLLDESLMEELMTEFRDVFLTKGAYDLHSQVPYLSRLAGHYKAKGVADNNNWVDLLKAHSLYNACFSREHNSKWTELAYRIQQSYWGEGVTQSPEQLGELTDELKNQLKKTRVSIADKLADLDSLVGRIQCDVDLLESDQSRQCIDKLTEGVKYMSAACSKEMVNFTNAVIAKSVQIIGEPPCSFAAVGIGSLAKGETTPYSDLEFLFLIEDTTGLRYFERLALTIYFCIGNLQETKLKYMNIKELKNDWFADVSTSGFKIDGLQPQAGNIPTGNGTAEQKNKFIKTVDEMVEIYTQVFLNPDPEEAKRGDLSAMLSSTVLLYGDHDLYDDFVRRIHSIAPSEARQEASKAMLKNDMKRYDYLPDETMMQIKDLKKDFYRFPSILVFDLKISHGIVHPTSWEVLETLKDRGFVSSFAYHSLMTLLSISIYSRLSAYAYHSSQNDGMSVLQQTDGGASSNHLWSFPRALLLYYFVYCIPIKFQWRGLEALTEPDSRVMKFSYIGTLYHSGDYTAVLECMENLERVSELSSLSQYHLIRIDSLIKTGRHAEAGKLIDETLGHVAESEKATLVALHQFRGILFEEENKYKAALECQKRALALRLQIHNPGCDLAHIDSDLYPVRDSLPSGDESSLEESHQADHSQGQLTSTAGLSHLDIAASYSDIGSIYRLMGEFSQALHYHQKSLVIQLDIAGPSSSDAATSYNNIAIIHQQKGDYQSAMDLYQKSLSTLLKVYGDTPHPRISALYNNIAGIYKSHGHYSLALSFYQRSLNIRRIAYGNGPHSSIAASYNNITDVYESQADYKSALEWNKKCLSMQIEIYGDSPHPAVAGAYGNIANIYQSQGDHRAAMEYSQRGLTLLHKIHGDSPNPQVASLYSNIANIHRSLGDYSLALENHQKSLKMRLKIYGSDPNPDVSNSYNNIASVYHSLNDYSSALEFCQKSLDIRLKIHGDTPHPQIASSYNNMAAIYQLRKDYATALEFYQKSLRLKVQIYSNSPHPDLASIYSNIGTVYKDLGVYDEALEYHKKGLAIRLQIYSDCVIHPEIAASFNNMALVYELLGDYRKSLELLNKSLQIFQAVFQSDSHPQVVTIRENIRIISNRLES